MNRIIIRLSHSTGLRARDFSAIAFALSLAACEGDTDAVPTEPSAGAAGRTEMPGEAGAAGEASAAGEAGVQEHGSAGRSTSNAGAGGEAGRAPGDGAEGGARGPDGAAGQGGGAGAEITADRACVSDGDCVHVEYAKAISAKEQCECPLCPSDFGRLPPINRSVHEEYRASFDEFCGELACPPLPCATPPLPRCEANVCVPSDPPVIDPTD